MFLSTTTTACFLVLLLLQCSVLDRRFRRLWHVIRFLSYLIVILFSFEKAHVCVYCYYLRNEVEAFYISDIRSTWLLTVCSLFSVLKKKEGQTIIIVKIKEQTLLTCNQL